MLKYILEGVTFLGVQGYMISQLIIEGIQKGFSAGEIAVECFGMFIIMSILSAVVFAFLEGSCGDDVKPSDMVPKYSPYGRFLSRMESLDKKENTK